MKNIFKSLIDTAALVYLAKHAPEAKYVGQTNPEEYQRELDRLDSHMREQRGLIQDKFKELRSQIKESYKTKERYEEKAADRAYQDRQDEADAAFRADLAKAQSDHRSALSERQNKIRMATEKLKQKHKDLAGKTLTTNQKLKIKNKINSQLDKFDQQHGS